LRDWLGKINIPQNKIEDVAVKLESKGYKTVQELKGPVTRPTQDELVKDFGILFILAKLISENLTEGTLSNPILSYPILSYPILSYPILSYPILSYPIIAIFV
jgi:hypothetical protein